MTILSIFNNFWKICIFSQKLTSAIRSWVTVRVCPTVRSICWRFNMKKPQLYVEASICQISVICAVLKMLRLQDDETSIIYRNFDRVKPLMSQSSIICQGLNFSKPEYCNMPTFQKVEDWKCQSSIIGRSLNICRESLRVTLVML